MSRRVSSVRIVGGKFKGLKIPYRASSDVRPTSNKNRETLFNWLINDIEGATCLDMFAGTGALGIEAISRGANFVYFCEKKGRMRSKIKKTVDRLNIHCQTDIININSLDFFFQHKIKEPLDIIFLDPPFRKNFIGKALKEIEKQGLVSKGSILFVEIEKEKEIEELFINWDLVKSKIGGQTRYSLFRCK